MGDLQWIVVDGDVDAPGWIAADRDSAGKSHALGNPAQPSVAASSAEVTAVARRPPANTGGWRLTTANCSLRAGAKLIRTQGPPAD
jgi:hypothetical protein